MPVRLDRHGPLAEIVLDRPEAGNALDQTMMETFAEVAAEVRADRSVRAVLLRGEGRNFCVGGDVKTFAEHLEGLPELLLELAATFHRGILDLLSIDAPIVCAVQGSAAGGGLSIACLGDLIVAGRSSRFVVAYPAIGLSPDGGSSFALPRLVGPRKALDLLLTNEPLDAEAALALGLVSRVVDDDAVVSSARELAAKLALGPTAAFGAAKRLLAASLTNTAEVQLELERVSIAALSGSVDGREGITAFVEKRAATFEGR
jgi:2-(1,2-epoxy-1,2-dihydrophenyl)acetyl-CoA isomerase